MPDSLFQLPHEPGAQRYRPDYLYRRCEQAVEHWLKRARRISHSRASDLPMPEVEFNLRGLNAGMAVFSGRRTSPGRIRINEDLLRRYPREMIQHTVPHEVAHLVAYALYRKTDHGEEWQSIMRYFGKPPTRCHQMQARPARQHKKYRYLCGCQEHLVGAQINARIHRGLVYTCRRCAEPLRSAA